MAATSPGRAGSTRLAADRLTATDRSCPASRQRRHWRERRARAPTGSAGGSARCARPAGTNVAGRSMPRSGWAQRTSASTPVICLRHQVELGLEVQPQLVVAGSRGAARRSGCRRSAPPLSAVRGSYSATRTCSALGLVHRDVGVLEQRVGVGAVVGEAAPRPPRPPRARSMPPHLEGLLERGQRRAPPRRRRRRRQQQRELVAAEPRHQSPRRRRAWASRVPTWRSSWSPAGWPSVSLMSLKRSRSISATAAVALLRPRPARAR